MLQTQITFTLVLQVPISVIGFGRGGNSERVAAVVVIVGTVSPRNGTPVLVVTITISGVNTTKVILQNTVRLKTRLTTTIDSRIQCRLRCVSSARVTRRVVLELITNPLTIVLNIMTTVSLFSAPLKFVPTARSSDTKLTFVSTLMDSVVINKVITEPTPNPKPSISTRLTLNII